MILFACPACQKQLSAPDADAGQLRRCPACKSTVQVPGPAPAPAQAPESELAAVGAPAAPAPPTPMDELVAARRPPVWVPGGVRTGGKRYGFNCGYCSSRLEATESMAAQDAQCPTCGNTITIPILDRYNRLIDPKTRQIIKQDPHPVHAYAAAGLRAPVVVRHADGSQGIQCPRCSTISPITANNCRTCHMPFTMEGTTLEATGATNGFCVASLVLGIIGLPAFCTIITPLLAIVFGAIGYNQVGKSGGGGKGMAIAGMVMGAAGCIGSVFWLLR